jgi:hypothetical protein
MKVSRAGIAIGEPLREFQGILTGVPQEREGVPTTLRVGQADAGA